MSNTFKPPAPDATPEEKQAALIAFRSALKQNMARYSTEQKERLVEAINDIEQRKVTLSNIMIENQSGDTLNTLMNVLVQRQQQYMRDLYDQEATNWDKVVDDFIAEKIAEA